MSSHHVEIFTAIYDRCIWGNDHDQDYRGSSGGGSTVEFNKDYIPLVRRLISEHTITSVVDLGCGSFLCGPDLYSGLDYHGFDAYKNIVDHNIKTFPGFKFTHLDVFTDREKIPPADLCVMKDILQHWSLTEVTTMLTYLTDSKKYKFILICNCCHQLEDNPDAPTGTSLPLSANFRPLKDYGAKILAKYHTKEVSLIQVGEEN